MLPPLRYRGLSLTETTSGDLHDSFSSSAQAGGSSTQGGVAQSWDSGSDPSEVTGVTFKIGADNAGIVGLVRAHVYAHTGTFGTSGEPTGDPLVSSAFYELDEVAETPTDYFFPLSGWTPDADTDYCAALEWFDVLNHAVSDVGAYSEGSAGGNHEGNFSFWDAAKTSWSSSSTADTSFEVYMQSAGGAASGLRSNNSWAATRRRRGRR